MSLELDISNGTCLCLRCTVSNEPDEQDEYSSEFPFQGGVWKLNYYTSEKIYSLYLAKCSGVAPDPLHLSVHVERSEEGRVENVLSQVEHFITDKFEGKDDIYCSIWEKEEEEIRLSVPAFRINGILTLVVVLRGKIGVKDSVATQTEVSIVEGVELPCVESLLEDFQRMMVQDSDRNVEFKCAEKSFKAHGAVVCARSAVICTMLGTDMVEGRTRIVEIPDMTPEVFRHFLEYLYTGKLPKLTYEVALSLYESGDQYAVLGLARRCRNYLVEHLTVQNSCDMLAVADAHSDKDFVEKVVVYMLETKVPQRSDRWPAFSDDHPKLANKVLKRGWDAWAPT